MTTAKRRSRAKPEQPPEDVLLAKHPNGQRDSRAHCGYPVADTDAAPGYTYRHTASRMPHAEPPARSGPGVQALPGRRGEPLELDGNSLFDLPPDARPHQRRQVLPTARQTDYVT